MTTACPEEAGKYKCEKKAKKRPCGNAPIHTVGSFGTQYGCYSRSWLGDVICFVVGCLFCSPRQFSFLCCRFTQCLVFVAASSFPLCVPFSVIFCYSLSIPFHFVLHLHCFFVFSYYYSLSYLHMVWYAVLLMSRPRVHCVRHCMAKSPVFSHLCPVFCSL